MKFDCGSYVTDDKYSAVDCTGEVLDGTDDLEEAKWLYYSYIKDEFFVHQYDIANLLNDRKVINLEQYLRVAFRNDYYFELIDNEKYINNEDYLLKERLDYKQEIEEMLESFYGENAKITLDNVFIGKEYEARFNSFKEKIKICCEIINRDVNSIAKTKDAIVIDVETTGLSREDDEILQLSIVDVDTKEVLFDEYFKPECKKSWEKAEAVNGISPKMVADKPSIFTKLDEIQEIIASAKKVVVYNSAFDVDFLEHYGINFSTNVIDDPMCYGAVVYGELKTYDDYDYYDDICVTVIEGFKWKKLRELAEWLGYEGDGWHNSTADCLATAYIYEECRKPERIEAYREHALANRELLTDDRYFFDGCSLPKEKCKGMSL